MDSKIKYIESKERIKDIAKLISKISKVVKGSIRLRLFEKELLDKKFQIDESAYYDGSVVPLAIYRTLRRSNLESSLESSYPEVIVTIRPILGNLFFHDFRDENVTVLSIFHWEAYEPPSLRSFLLYAAIRSLLVLRYKIPTHPRKQPCVLYDLASKDDIRCVLYYDFEEPFCQGCRASYKNSLLEVRDFTRRLKAWVKRDFKSHIENIRVLSDTQRRVVAGHPISKEDEYKIQLFEEYSVTIQPSFRAYKYLLKKGCESNDEIFVRFPNLDLQHRTNLKERMRNNDSR